MKIIKKYWLYLLMLISFVLVEMFLDGKNELKVEAALFLAAAAFILAKDLYQRKKYAYCPQCGALTETGWHTEHLDAADKPVRIGLTWHFGGKFTQKTAIIRCKHCGWKINRFP